MSLANLKLTKGVITLAISTFIPKIFRNQFLWSHDFSGEDLRRADLAGADLRGVNLREADLTGVT